LKGSFDKFAESERQKRGTTEVDAEFLKEIESWREALAKDIAMKNQKLSIRDLNYAVQITIDRIIFLRMCEDRGIEKYGQIQNLLNGTNIYRRLREIFFYADDKYNSGLFDFKTDQLTPELKIDDCDTWSPPKSKRRQRSFSWIEPFFLKRKCFEHECEVRALINKASKKQNYDIGFNVSIDVAELIECIYVDPNAKKWFIDLVELMVSIEPDLKNVSITKSPLGDRPWE